MKIILKNYKLILKLSNSTLSTFFFFYYSINCIVEFSMIIIVIFLKKKKKNQLWLKKSLLQQFIKYFLFIDKKYIIKFKMSTCAFVWLFCFLFLFLHYYVLLRGLRFTIWPIMVPATVMRQCGLFFIVNTFRKTVIRNPKTCNHVTNAN